ncbi:hypothetical protein GCM10007301_11780 [Azorhizobium oxalatiphilum]|uniref:Uncharacterized protein n=1 Tax=Azorhizobium oxalatiphilum TaxID=980631 RepID=A0A917BS30_9HYPH|nr:hypothetical protein [Azorhizobium oxalatiphilum]GGF53936.1 hypothetical protein GCM10007301_11780 [Azorhizobium oxalatiphilum]
MRYISLMVTALTLASLTGANAEDRYPIWLPQWIWQNEPYSDLLRAEQIDDFKLRIAEIEKLDTARRTAEADEKTLQLNRALAQYFSLRDFSRLAPNVEDPASGRAMSLILDPAFPEHMKPVLEKAGHLFLKTALNREVIENAFRRAADNPLPTPSRTVTDGTVTGVTNGYRLYLKSRLKPVSAEAFYDEMKHALTGPADRRPALVISSYSDQTWWGGGYHDFYYRPDTQLNRLSPPGSFLYIRLSTDKMSSGSDSFDNPSFWASKIAHEALHNLGYWHPPYKDARERDEQVKTSLPFIVAYEQEILRAASAP